MVILTGVQYSTVDCLFLDSLFIFERDQSAFREKVALGTFAKNTADAVDKLSLTLSTLFDAIKKSRVVVIDTVLFWRKI